MQQTQRDNLIPGEVWTFDLVDQLSETTSVADGDDSDENGEVGPHTEQFTLANQYQRNLDHYEAMPKKLAHLNGDGSDYEEPIRNYLVTPTASHIPSKCLHPWFYTRCAGIDLDTLANDLQVTGGWRQQIDEAIRHSDVSEFWRRFNTLDKPEVKHENQVFGHE